jgi:hypothetical protein
MYPRRRYIKLPTFKGRQPFLEEIEVRDSSNHDTEIFQDNSIDINYFKEQLEFINSLSERERTVLASYTHQGDGLINGMLRGTLTGTALCDYMKTTNLPFLETPTESNCQKLAKSYLTEFSTIFKRVPVLKTKMRVFRGFRPDQGWKPMGFYIKATSPTQDYMSTTYSAGDGSFLGEYIDTDKDVACCVMELILEPGIRALWIEPISKYQGEREIVIESGVAIYNGCIAEKFHTYMNYHEEDEPDILQKVTVYEYNIKPYETWMTKLGKVLYEVGLKCSTRRKGARRKRPRSTYRNRNRARQANQ